MADQAIATLLQGCEAFLFERADAGEGPPISVKLWEEGSGEMAPGCLFLLPFDGEGTPISNLDGLLTDSQFASAPTSVRLVVTATEAAALATLAPDLDPQKLYILPGDHRKGQILGNRDRIDRPYWQGLFDLLESLASAQYVAVLPTGRLHADVASGLDPASLDRRLLALATQGLQCVFFPHEGLEEFRSYAIVDGNLDPLRLPTISVIMPLYNAEGHLSEALDSLLRQSFTDFEIVCVVDGATDRTAEILEAAAEKDGRIRLYRQANKGVSAARNRGLALARGRYICFADADDWLQPDSLVRRLACLEGGPEMLCGGRAVFVDEVGSRPWHVLRSNETCLVCQRL